MSRYSMVCPVCGEDMDYIEEAHGELSEFGYTPHEPGYWECPFCGELAYGDEDEDFYALDD